MVLGNNVRACLLFALLSGLAHGQAVAPNKGRELVNRAVSALGGDAFLSLRNRVSTGRLYGFFHDELSQLELVKEFTEYPAEGSPSGLGVRTRQLLGKKQDYSYLFLPDKAWDITFRGARPLSDEQWSQYERSTRYNILYLLRTRLNEPGMQFDYVSSEVYLSRHVEIVDITDSKDQVIRVYFDHNTALPVHETYSWYDPVMKAHNDEVIEFDKYRDAGGVTWPFSIERTRNGYKAYQFFSDKITVNQPLPAGIFDVPGSAKVLKRVD